MSRFNEFGIPAIIVAALVIIGAVSTARADVAFVSGDVSGVWTADSVFVTDSIYVSPGNTLEIEPGVHVLFLTANYFRVRQGALLRAVGTETDTIKFLPAVDGYNTLGIDFDDASDQSILEYCYFTHALYSAIALTNSDITIRNCLLENNSGHYRGGGISALEGSDALIEYNVIRDNSTVQQGGGIYCDDSSPTIRGNIIDGNRSGPIATGGGISCSNHSSPLIVDNTFIDNQVFPSPIYPSTVGQGAAIYCSNLSNPTITGNMFFNNRVNSGGAIGQGGGGAIFVFAAAPVIENNVFAGNVVEYGDGGALYLFIYNGTLVNNVFMDNNAVRTGGAIYMDLSNPSVTNCVLYGNSAPEGPVIYLDRSSTVTVTYSDIEGGWQGEGNVDVDPMFRDPASGDYHLMAIDCGDQYDSPLIDAGSPAYIDSLLDCSWGLGTVLSDIGAYGGGAPAGPTAIGDDEIVTTPSEFFAVSNYPNPFNAQTTISYRLPEDSRVSIDIYDNLGRKVRTLVNETQSAGRHEIAWEASDMASGLYFYRIQTNNYKAIRKMALLK
jgi:hypothetical protein